jgi:REP element-mobilizing transposase RayT
LADSLPSTVLQRWEEELAILPIDEASMKRRARIEHALDSGHGNAALLDPRIAEIVENAVLFFDGARYRLLAWVIMPNHVHVLITPFASYSLSSITHSWKSFTAKQANKILARSGAFWAAEYFDRAIRNEAHLADAFSYFAMNPVKAHLCNERQNWRFSSWWSGRNAGGTPALPGESEPTKVAELHLRRWIRHHACVAVIM